MLISNNCCVCVKFLEDIKGLRFLFDNVDPNDSSVIIDEDATLGNYWERPANDGCVHG
jgi:hypothetical protein